MHNLVYTENTKQIQSNVLRLSHAWGRKDCSNKGIFMLELEIKKLLTSYLSANTNSDAFLEEVELSGGQVRADFVDAENMHCYEIKSEADSLNRLLNQGARYSRVFDKVTLVTAEKHLTKALELVPDWWGIILVSDCIDGKLVPFRAAKKNRNLDPRVLATLLKREEAIHLLTVLGLCRGWKSKSLYQLQDYISETLPFNKLKSEVSFYLKLRTEYESFNKIQLAS